MLLQRRERLLPLFQLQLPRRRRCRSSRAICQRLGGLRQFDGLQHQLQLLLRGTCNKQSRSALLQ
jgi:hypothetical protein